MTRISKTASLGLFVWSLLNTAAYAAPVPGLDVPKLVRDSEVIVLGNVDRTTRLASPMSGSEQPAGLWEAEITVDQLLKGEDERAQMRCRFVGPTSSNAFGGLHASEYQLIFLRREKDHYVPTSPFYPSLSTVPMARVRGGSPLDRVAEVLESTLFSPSVGNATRIDVVRQLGTIQTTQAQAALHRALNEHEDAKIKAAAAAMLLKAKDLTGLGIAVSVLSSTDPQDAQLRSEIVMTIADGVVSTEAIPVILPLLGSPAPELRRAAALALRHTGSRVAIPHLVSALSDEDASVRYAAVMGLAEITEDWDHAPSIGLFRADEAKYLTYWKKWGRSHR